MKVIYPDNITATSASTANANFPVTNLATDYVKQVWKATGATATLTLTVSSGDAVALFGTNATSATVTVYTAPSCQWATGFEWATGFQWNEDDSAVTTAFDLSSSNVGSIWADYTARAFKHIIEIALTTTAGGIVEAGVVRAGDAKVYVDPAYGITEGLKDYSILKELNNGAFYTRKRDVVRTFSFEMIEDRDTDFYEFMSDIAQLTGPDPVAWRISTNNTDWEWVVYARFDSMPRGTHNTPTYSRLNVSLIEVV